MCSVCVDLARPYWYYNNSASCSCTDKTIRMAEKMDPEGTALDGEAGVYLCPSVRKPTLDQITELARGFGLHMEDGELRDMHKLIGGNIDGINSINHLVEPILPTRYPRLPGHQPEPKDNPHNAWFWRCEIKGASSGKLAGKTVAIKDNIAIAGVPLMMGCSALEGFTPNFDATVVTRILDAGGTIIGKAQCENICFSGGSSTSFPAPVTNPHNPKHQTGGSSSGSAVLVSIGEADLAVGGDQGGSIRLPSCWTGVVGIKPTFGLVPHTGALGLDPAIDHLGPMARTVKECALFLEVLAGYDDGLDARQHPNITVPEYSKELEKGDIEGLRVGILTEGFAMEGTDPAVGRLLKKVIYKLADHGATVDDVSIPIHTDSHTIWGASVEGCLENISRNGGQGLGHTGYYSTQFAIEIGKMLKTRPDDLPDTVKMFMLQNEYLKRQYRSQVYCRGRNLVITLRKAYDEALKKFDIIALPTIPFTASKLISKDDPMEEVMNKCFKMTVNTMAFNLTGHPAISVNGGFLEDLPVGLMLVGKHFDDLTVLKVAQAVENIRDAKK